MSSVISFTPEQLIAGVLAMCTALGTIAGAVVIVLNVVKALRKPNEDQNSRLTKLEERVAKHDELFDNDKQRLEAIEAGNRFTHRALLALLDHGIDGNNVEQMRNAKADLQRHLIER